jgi:hypothetical protein
MIIALGRVYCISLLYLDIWLTDFLIARYGHLLVSDFSDSVPSIPPENLQDFMVDPRIRGLAQNEDQVANPLGNGHTPRDVANRNALAVLFESMLPWVHYGDEDGGEAD